MSRVVRRAAVVLVAIGLLVTGTAYVVRSLINTKLPAAQTASCDVINSPYTLSTEQAANAATISAVAISRKLPSRAVAVALATALQESKLINVEYGDRDSVGLFQQRPSQGWGSQGQILDPRYSAGKFFDALVKVRGWETMPLTAAAQAVQQSAHPTAYRQWEDQAGTLTKAFTGAEPALLSCSFPEPTVAASPAKVMQLLALELPHTKLSATPQMGELKPGEAPWATAGWLVAKADRLGIEAVALDGRRWTRSDGWRVDAGAATDRVRFEVAKIPPAA
ncbi:MAG TPA: hypothetical protein VGP36_22980 [Mycobacteriales bacterium]|jgi:hypothetical protein|nr:hypothetical protein [Mycobacteriales bacterium]